MTDTHWTAKGAMISARELLRALGRPLDPVDPDRYELGKLAPVGGDLMNILGSNGTGELVPVIAPAAGWHWKRNAIPFPTNSDGSAAAEMSNPKGEGTALILCDSFTERFAPYLAESFARVIFIRNRLVLAESVRQFKPTVVIDEFVERIVAYTDPDAMGLSSPATSGPAPYNRSGR